LLTLLFFVAGFDFGTSQHFYKVEDRYSFLHRLLVDKSTRCGYFCPTGGNVCAFTEIVDFLYTEMRGGVSLFTLVFFSSEDLTLTFSFHCAYLIAGLVDHSEYVRECLSLVGSTLFQDFVNFSTVLFWQQ